ncbi:DUF4142 domain-containing protein [Nocardia veterana]|uniref:DUF4142 domain-containing protein n=1 Tax=Nocardia veterana TaxID=132249 RepID=A0A7X6LZD1_9NOCA|nr:DUF4142 domain-containing protein [Nocardia veterana]NKY87388.1 DUF4142 domain-containing protein [Nocardia veterana]
MRSRHRLALAAAVAAAVASSPTAIGSAQPPPPTAQDSDFLVAAHQGNLTELASGAHAAVLGSCQPVRDIGAMLVADHARLEAMGGAVAVTNGIALPLTPTPDQSRQLTETGMKSGRDYDLAWLRMQEGFHTDTLQAATRELGEGSAPQVTAVAQAATPVVEHHLALIRDAMGVC